MKKFRLELHFTFEIIVEKALVFVLYYGFVRNSKQKRDTNSDGGNSFAFRYFFFF